MDKLPVDKKFIPLFTGFYTSQVVCRISSINSMSTTLQAEKPDRLSVSELLLLARQFFALHALLGRRATTKLRVDG